MSAKRVLVVEDEAIVAMDVVNRLKILGYDIAAVAADGEKAINAAMTLSPDLILMDIMLQGDMDGIEAASIIRQNMAVPVIYLTAYADYNTCLLYTSEAETV